MANSAATKKPKKLPPMLQQYLEYKKAYPDVLLFIQVGDFYESFFQDAVTISETLNITLTTRDKNSPDPIPMSGVPIAVIDGYADRLVNQGYSVAMVSQCEIAKPGKMVQRKLDRIITPGVRVLGNNEEGISGDPVAAISFEGNDGSIAFAVPESGVVFVRENIQLESITGELSRIQPAEVVIPAEWNGKRVDRRSTIFRTLLPLVGERAIRIRNAGSDSGKQADPRRLSDISGYGQLGALGKQSARILIQYFDEVTVESQLSIREIQTKSYEGVVSIDARTRRNLDLISSFRDGTKTGTLFEYLDCCVTGSGSRLLREWIISPLMNVIRIDQRLNTVEFFLKRSQRSELQDLLRKTSDLERIAARIELGAVLPGELAALRDTLIQVPEVSSLLESLLETGPDTSNCVEEVREQLQCPTEIQELLERSLVDRPSPTLQEGGIFQRGYSTDLDRLLDIREKGAKWIADLEGEAKEETGISSMKIRFNNVLGYFFEVPKGQAAKVPDTFTKRQSTANAERYYTEALKQREEEVLQAKGRQIELERKLYQDLRVELRQSVGCFRAIARALSTLDVFLGLATLALSEDLVRPVIDDSSDLQIDHGKHPVLSKLLEHQCIPNSLLLTKAEGNFAILTGPNMGGKSTYLRQAGLLVIMAQLGSFLPVRSARIGCVDRIFARLGASDDPLEGESTFMVEMKEASYILAGATDRSLILIDEIGRGTATTDGIALARSILEWIIQKIGSRALFATHFHELTNLEGSTEGLKNLSVGSAEEEGKVIFTHRILDGPARRSYGLEVAKLAGLPNTLLSRAAELVREEEQESKKQLKKLAGTSQIGLFETPQVQEPADYVELQSLRDAVREVRVEEMSPLEAINELWKLRDRAQK